MAPRNFFSDGSCLIQYFVHTSQVCRMQIWFCSFKTIFTFLYSILFYSDYHIYKDHLSIVLHYYYRYTQKNRNLCFFNHYQIVKMVVYRTSCKMGFNPCPPQATLPLLKLLSVLTLNWDDLSHYCFEEWLFKCFGGIIIDNSFPDSKWYSINFKMVPKTG